MILYLYDIKTELKDYNRIKRRFYYNLKKSQIAQAEYLTKSVLLIPEELEQEADLFFSKFIRYVEVYKARVSAIEEI